MQGMQPPGAAPSEHSSRTGLAVAIGVSETLELPLAAIQARLELKAPALMSCQGRDSKQS